MRAAKILMKKLSDDSSRLTDFSDFSDFSLLQIYSVLCSHKNSQRRRREI